MSETVVETVAPKTTMEDLKTVKFLKEQSYVITTLALATALRENLKQRLIVSWFVVAAELYFIWLFTLATIIPWPAKAQDVLVKADAHTEVVLVWLHDKVEWVGGFYMTHMLPHIKPTFPYIENGVNTILTKVGMNFKLKLA